MECKYFINKSSIERNELANEYKACWCRLRIGHRKVNCYEYRECKKDGCKQFHHPLLHNDDIKKASKQNHVNVDANNESESDKEDTEYKQSHATNTFDNTESQNCLLQLMKISAGTKNVGTLDAMWDSGATVSMITFKKARELDLVGAKTDITIVKVGGEKEVVNSKLYDVPIHDLNGNIEVLKAYGIKQISTSIDSVETSKLAQKLQVKPIEVQRPAGEIDMLIGIDYAGFHPEKISASGHLVLMKNKFGTCLSGSSKEIEENTKIIVKNVSIYHAIVKIEDFYNSEGLGVTCQPKCGSCRCGEFPIGGKQYSLQHERELAMIESGLELSNGIWTARYPWKRNPNDLPNNRVAAMAM